MAKILVVFAAIVVACGLIGCFAAPEGYTRLETKDFVVPSSWARQGRTAGSKMIKLQFAIKQSNVEKLTVRNRYKEGQ